MTMTREEAIKIIDCYDIGFYDLSGEKIPADKLADAFDMAIEALSADAVDLAHDIPEYCRWSQTYTNMVQSAMADTKSADAVKGWIPLKWHEITEEERAREGYPKDWVVHIDCDMPNDGDEILVQTKNGYIRWDVCYEEGEFSLDSGWDWIEDIVAWMPLPTPYKGGDTE